jgi:hypothetical protein
MQSLHGSRRFAPLRRGHAERQRTFALTRATRFLTATIRRTESS